MKLIKPKFWDKENSLIALLLSPLSLVTELIIFIKRKIILPSNFNIPIVCIGNIYLGGTGKTPLSILVAKELKKKKKNNAIVRKYYPDHIDEYDLIKESFQNLITNSYREDAINEAKLNGYDGVILDDGFQDFKINKDLSILCFNSSQLIGNGFLIPAGPLRESLNAIRRANVIVINGNKILNFEKRVHKINKNIKFFYSKYKLENVRRFKNKKILAFAGIGNPENFFDLLEENNLDLKKKIIFPDHYKFERKELLKIISFAKKNRLKIITTEKDYYRIKEFKLRDINFLKLNLEIKNKKKLINGILKIYN
tara:strand:+ start:3932 stop:4864 length:933 start_codon:yes stop_codon:yes gene_type:complete